LVSRQRPIEGRSRVVAYLPEDLVQALDRVALKHNATRSEVVARLVERSLRDAAASAPPEPPRAEPEAAPEPPSRASRPEPPSPPEEIPPERPPSPPRWEDDPDTLYPKAGCPRRLKRGVRCNICSEVHRA
jgi:hypothetical protein